MEKHHRNNSKGIEDNAIQSVIVHEDNIRTVFRVITIVPVLIDLDFSIIFIFTAFFIVSPNISLLLWLNLLGT